MTELLRKYEKKVETPFNYFLNYEFQCLAAGSSIMNREAESTAMRPLAKAVTRSLENVRNLLREACLRNNTPNGPIKLDTNELVTEMLLESLKIFDKLFAQFELAYVSAMVPVKSTQEYELQELIGVLFSETLQRALKMQLLTQEMVDDCDPALMFTIPRLAIVSGLLVFPNGPLCIDKPMEEMSEMFRPFRTLLHKIRELLWTLNKRELYMLEKLLCDNEQISDVKSVSDYGVSNDLDNFIDKFYNDYPLCKDYISNFYTVSVNNGDIDAEPVDEATEIVQKEFSENVDIPSTSGYLMSNTISSDSIAVASNAQNSVVRVDSLPDHDSLEVISVAAATLSTLLSKNPPTAENSASKPENDVESTDDSGICTENTSLDRSPSLEMEENRKKCKCPADKSPCRCSNSSSRCRVKKTYRAQVDFSPGTSKSAVKSKEVSRKRSKVQRRCDEKEEDSSSSDTSSFDSNCADDEEIALAMQAAELASRNEVRAKYR